MCEEPLSRVPEYASTLCHRPQEHSSSIICVVSLDTLEDQESLVSEHLVTPTG